MYTEWSDELSEVLAAPFPDEAHKTLTKGGTDITFVSVWDYIHRLNSTVGVNGWETHTELSSAGGRLIANVSLTILGVTKSNVGDEEEDKEGYGTAATNAYAQAFKRAAAEFGLGLYLYEKGSKPKPASRQPHDFKLKGGPHDGRWVSQVTDAGYLVRWLRDDPPTKQKKGIVQRLRDMGVPSEQYMEWL